MRGIEEKCSRARPAPPLHHLYVADVQRLVFFRHAHHANGLAVALEHEVLRFAPATQKKIASPHEIVAAVVAVHVVARERLGERKIVHRRQAQLKRRESFGGIEHCAMKALNQVINTKSAGARWQWRVLRARKFDVTHATRSTRCNGMVVRRIAGGTKRGNGENEGKRKRDWREKRDAQKTQTKKIQLKLDFLLQLVGGADGTRTRDTRRDRPVF